MEKYIEPIVVKTLKGYAILHETGIYFLDKDENLNENLVKISQKRRKESALKKEEREKIAKVVIFLSSNCNLRCIYCYASSGTKCSVVNKENAKLLINYVAEKVDRIILDFHGGGEPLLYFDIIKELVDFTKSTGKLFRTVLISNGVLTDNEEEKLNWIIKNIDVMGISCDGFPEIQNKNRPYASGDETSSKVEKTIKFFNEHNYIYTVRSTIIGSDAEKLLDITKYFHSIGVKYLIYAPCYNYGRSDDKTLVPNPQIYVENFMKSLNFAYENGIRLTTSSFRFPGYNYCGALSGFNLALTTDNYISTCYEVTSSDDKAGNPFLVGKIENGKINISKEKLSALADMDAANSTCSKCDYRLVCRGGCPVKRVRGSKDSLVNLCGITKLLVPKILDFLQENPNAANSILRNVIIDF